MNEIGEILLGPFLLFGLDIPIYIIFMFFWISAYLSFGLFHEKFYGKTIATIRTALFFIICYLFKKLIIFYFSINKDFIITLIIILGLVTTIIFIVRAVKYYINKRKNNKGEENGSI